MSDPVEHHAVENVIARLTERFPSLSRDRVQQVVDEELARFEDRRVREYIPALVEHAADERLREEADPMSVALAIRADRPWSPTTPPRWIRWRSSGRHASSERDSSSATSVADPSDGSFVFAYRSVARRGTLHAWRRRGST